MSREEYQKLVKSAYSFSQLDAETKEKILNAEADEMLAYAKMFEQENETMKKAVKDFSQSNEQVIIDFKATVKKGEHKERMASESAQKNKEEQALNNLLNKI